MEQTTETYPAGVLKQIALFERDYRNGEAIVKRYLKVINNPAYFARAPIAKRGNYDHSILKKK